MPTEHDYIDVRDLFVSINPNGLDQSELVRDGASFVEPQTINDYHLFRAGYQAALEAKQGQGDPVAFRCIDPDGDEGNWYDADPASLQAARNDVERGFYSRLELAYTHADPAEVERLRAELRQEQAQTGAGIISQS
ncbi:MAG: hypothetical protein K0S77_3782 [Pseudomonas sp.]|jgi:hypothetical protein|nr:hypothetical protein [Pseudomonas sp.]